MMDTEEIQSVLDERRESFESCTIEEALTRGVDADKFYRFIGSIRYINIGDSGEVWIRFEEPVPGQTTLDPGYKYTVTVNNNNVYRDNDRCGMPREDLIVLQQVSIVVWAMANGFVGTAE